MNEEMFNELLVSVEQIDGIIHDGKKPSREFHFDKPQSKAGPKPDSFAAKQNIPTTEVQVAIE